MKLNNIPFSFVIVTILCILFLTKCIFGMVLFCFSPTFAQLKRAAVIKENVENGKL